MIAAQHKSHYHRPVSVEQSQIRRPSRLKTTLEFLSVFMKCGGASA